MSRPTKPRRSSGSGLVSGRPWGPSRIPPCLPVPVNKPSAVNVPDPQAVQDSVILAQQIEPQPVRSGLLSARNWATTCSAAASMPPGFTMICARLPATSITWTSACRHRRPEPATRSPTAANPENVSKARALIQRDLDQMRTQDVSPDELHLAKALLLRQIPLGESSEEAVAEGSAAPGRDWLAAR